MENKDDFALQMVTIKILKYDIAINEDNQKYVAKIFDNPQLIEYFYPEYAKKYQNTNIICTSSSN